MFGKALTPVRASDRNPAIDVLRGAALCGILIINIIYFSHPLDHMGMREGLYQSLTDTITGFFCLLLVEGKFYPLFSLLFGMGFAIQMDRARERGRKISGLYRRRMLILMGIGLAHAIFLWEGDILFHYGLLGFLLLAFQRRKPKTLVIWACVLIGLQCLLLVGLACMLCVLQAAPEFSAKLGELMSKDPALHRELKESYVEGGYRDVVALRAKYWLETTTTLLMVFATFFGMFLIGMHPVTRAAMRDPESKRALLRKCALWCGCIGLAINAISATLFLVGVGGNDFGLLLAHVGLISVGGPILTFAYVSAFMLCSKRLLQNRIIRALGDAGRMSLSNYLLQSLIATTIFYGYGLGWAGSLGRLETVVVALGIFVLQVLASKLWLKKFRYGPMEWLWRSLTYGKRQPMKLSS